MYLLRLTLFINLFICLAKRGKELLLLLFLLFICILPDPASGHVC